MSIFTWKSNINKTYKESYESLNFDSLVGNLTDFDPENSTSYTNMNTINVNYQSSNTSWSHYRDFDNDVSLPSTNIAAAPLEIGHMVNPYDTTVFFARKDAVYNITASWEHDPLGSDLDANLFLLNQSQFHNFENYIKPWRTIVPKIVTSFKSDSSSDDWLIEYNNTISGSGTLNHTKKFEDVTFNKTGWYYLVMWGPGYHFLFDNPKVATSGILLSEGPENDLITANDLMNIYRPSLGRVVGTITKPNMTYERIVRGEDEIYGDSLVLLYIYEFSNRQLQNTITWSDNDWAPFIVYINPDSVGKFPNRVVYFHDDSWADFKDRYIKVIDPNSSLGDGTYSYVINITAEFAPFLNETVSMKTTISTTPISMENRLGASLRLATTTNSHGFDIKPYDSTTGITYSWNEIPKVPLDNLTLGKLYNDTIIEFLENGWSFWGGIVGKYYPKKTPFSLYFKSLFTAPYLVSGLENILLVKAEVKNWFENLIPMNTYFNSRLDIEVNTTIDIPVNFTITYPENEPGVGQSGNFTLALGAMGNPNITIDYKVTYSMNFSMMLFSGSYSINKSDTIHFSIPLKEIDCLLGIFGVDDGLSGLASRKCQEYIDEALEKSKVDEYISIEDFTLGDHVVGNIVSCNITIHLWPIIKYLGETYLPAPHSYYFKAAKYIIDKILLNETTGLDLVISPQLQGVLTGVIVGNGLDFSNGGQFEFNATQQSVIFQADRTQDFSPTSIQLQSLLYKLNFHIDWAFEINFNKFLHKYFGQEDLRWELGTYPSIDFAHNPMPNSELVSLNWNEWTPPSAPSPPILTITTPSPTSSLDIALDWTTSTGADNYTLYRHTSAIISSNLNSATEIKTITGTSTTDTVSGVGRWYYAVVATNETGSSDPSNSPYIDVQSPPSAPSPPILTITTSSPSTSYDISLTWATSTGADNYTLYRHTSQITSGNLNSATEIKTITGTSTTDTVSGVGRWYYAVVATNEVGSSDPSNSPYIDVQDEPTDVAGGEIPGYPLIFLVLFSLTGIILIIHKKEQDK